MSVSPVSSPKTVNPWIGVAVVLAVVIAVNMVAKSVRLRVDLTEEKQFTLSSGTEQFLRGLPSTVTLKLYYSRGNHVPGMLKQYIQRTVDLLREMERASGGKLVLEIYDPQPDSDEEEWALRYGLVGQPVNPLGGDPIYLGLVAVSGQREAAIPFLAPNAEAQLEYNIARLAHEVSRATKARIGVMSNLPVMGAPRPPTTRGRPADEGWLAIRELRRHYDVVAVRPEGEGITPDITTLVVIHPKMLTEKTLYAIDQFVMRGGRLIVFQDPMSLTERNTNPDMSGMGMFMGFGSDLNRLTAAWGAELTTGDVVADFSAASQITFGSGQVERMPTWLNLRAEHINQEDALTANIRTIMLPFAGGFELRDVEGVTATPLLTASPDAVAVSAFMATSPGPDKMRDARPVGALPLAVRLHGRFASAFPDGRPGMDDEASDENAAQHLARAEQDGVVILVGDVDFIFDQNAFRMMNLFGQTIVELANDNFNLMLSMVEQATGSEALIGLRSRGVRDRAFSRVLALEEAAQRRWQEEEIKLLERLQETQRRLSELQAARDDQQQTIISPEQQAEIENFRQLRFDTQRELKQVRRNLRQDIEQLGFQVKAANMVAIPALVALYGLVRGWRRRQG
ncbi:MAG TPA: Gldg family protein [Kiritimatiellia bacterium]|nr:Gldg family protein [Kiritimatiellia bacterium]HMO99386.1 Gldg family protein [Kiritimatiellia bacterium]HMP96508.1 Gldg family protein [Kiritimatiellia bacterium]